MGIAFRDVMGPNPIYTLPAPAVDDIPELAKLFKGITETTIHNVPPLFEVSDNWESAYFEVDNVRVRYYIARAKKERGVIIGCSGLKSETPLTKEAVQDLNDAGHSVLLMVIPNAKRALNTIRYSQEIFEHLAFDTESPAHTKFSSHLPKFLYGHSTGGAFAIDLSTNERTKNKAKKLFKVNISESAFVDTAGASLHDSKWSQYAFNLYAKWHKNSLPKETLCGLFYLHHSDAKEHYLNSIEKIKKYSNLNNLASNIVYETSAKNLSDDLQFFTQEIKNKTVSKFKKGVLTATFKSTIAYRTVRDLYFSEDFEQKQSKLYQKIKYGLLNASKPIEPAKQPWFLEGNAYRIVTYGQVLEDQYIGRKLTAAIRDEKRTSSIPMISIATKDDPFSCTTTIKRDIAEPLNAKFYIGDGIHNTISEDTEIRRKVIEALSPYIEDITPTDELVQVIIPENDSEWRVDTSGNRFGRAFQRATSLLNSSTGFAKRLFGSRIRNTEVRGKTESSSMNASDSFRLK